MLLNLRRHLWLTDASLAGYFLKFSDYEPCSLLFSILEVHLAPSPTSLDPVFIATTSASIIPRRHSSAYRSWTTSHFIRCFLCKERKKWGSSKWRPSFADFFVLHQKAFLRLSWRIQAQSRKTPPVCSNSTLLTGTTQLNELFKWGCNEMKWILNLHYIFFQLFMGWGNPYRWLFPSTLLNHKEKAERKVTALFARPEGDYCLLCGTNLH